MINRRSFLAAAVMSGLAVPTEAAAQAYPSRRVTLIVPSPAGSTPDLLARLLGDKLRPMMGQDFIVENPAVYDRMAVLQSPHEPAT